MYFETDVIQMRLHCMQFYTLLHRTSFHFECIFQNEKRKYNNAVTSSLEEGFGNANVTNRFNDMYKRTKRTRRGSVIRFRTTQPPLPPYNQYHTLTARSLFHFRNMQMCKNHQCVHSVHGAHFVYQNLWRVFVGSFRFSFRFFSRFVYFGHFIFLLPPPTPLHLLVVLHCRNSRAIHLQTLCRRILCLQCIHHQLQI